MTPHLLVLPVVIPLATAIVLLFAERSRVLQRWLSVASNALLLIVAGLILYRVSAGGPVAINLGDWQAPFGITFAGDVLTGLMLVVTAITAVATAIYSLGSIDAPRERYGYHSFLQIMLMGVNGAFLTADIFNLFVWFEVMLIASFVLMALGGEKRQMEGAVKYVTLNLISSALFLIAVGLLYGKVGTLNMADLALHMEESMSPELITATGLLFMIAFGLKAGVFPLYSWLPASYHTPPVAVSAIFAGLLTKVGVYALMRVFTLIFTVDQSFTHQVLLVIALLTMVTGVFGAIVQFDFRRLLSFHIISQIGYMILGLALAFQSTFALAGGIFYVFHHIIVKANLYFISGVGYAYRGTFDLKKLGGLWREYPWLAVLFLVPAMSLAGIPPLSGFWAKFAIVKAGLGVEAWIAVGISLAVGLLTLFSMLKIWAEAFWKEAPEATAALPRPQTTASDRRALYTTVVFLAALTVAIGLFPEPLFVLANQAAAQLMDPSAYIEAVLNPTVIAP